MANFVAVYDACVLHPAPLRDLLVRMPVTGRFRARWTEAIHQEWMASVRSARPDLSPDRLERTRQLMDQAVPECLVTGYEGAIESLVLPDPSDRHVLAAAIRCQAGVIVTYNLRDFPPEALTPWAIDALPLDLVGLDDAHAFAHELLPEPPSRWYLTGFLVPESAPIEQRSDEGTSLRRSASSLKIRLLGSRQGPPPEEG